ncbi:hypothetical protein WJX79_004261 [Trebouxia sp. C0005]
MARNVAASEEVPKCNRSQSAAQKALKTGKPCLQSARQPVAYIKTADTSEIQQKLLNFSHILVVFQMSVGIHLAGPDAALLDEIAGFPQTPDHKAPPVLKLLFGSLRGHAGEINPAAALDAVATGGNVVIVDIRTSRKKQSGGVPDLPFDNRLIEVEYAEIVDRKVQGQLQNVGAIERQVTALQIASLKKVNKRTQILLLDKNGSTSKAIAKELSRKGFRKIRVIQGGFSGWTSSKLQTKMSNTVSAVKILAPVFGTVKKAASSSNGNSIWTIRNALPNGR